MHRQADLPGDGDRSKSDLDRALRLAPQGIRRSVPKALSLDRQRPWEKSIEVYQHLIEQRPNDVRGYHGLGNAQLRLGRTDEALTTWHNGLATVGRGRLRLHVGVIAVLIGERRCAEAQAELETLNRAIRFLATSEGEQHRDSIVSSRDLLVARLHMAKSEYPQPRPCCGKSRTPARQMTKFGRKRRMRLGTCMLKMQEWKNAAISFEQVLDVHPRSAVARLAAARAWIAEGSRHGEDQAIRLCSDVVEGRTRSRCRLADVGTIAPSQPNEPTSWSTQLAKLEQVLSRAHAALPDSWKSPGSKPTLS